MSCRWPVLLCALVAAIPATAQTKASVPMPAIGSDWNDGAANDDRLAQSLWPRDDAAAAGVDDMIHDERLQVRPDLGMPADGRLFRTLRKVGGDYIVVPVLKLHFRHAGER